MYKVLVPASQILGQREATARKTISPVLESDSALCFRQQKTAAQIVLAAYQGVPGIKPPEKFIESRLKTVVPDYLASYFEIWNRDYENSDEENFYLFKAYFHIYWIKPGYGEKEYILLHCDPNEPDTEAHAKYKQVPHLHLEMFESPWPKAHIALNAGSLSHHVLTDANSLSGIMQQAVEMLVDEVMTPLLEIWRKKQ